MKSLIVIIFIVTLGYAESKRSVKDPVKMTLDGIIQNVESSNKAEESYSNLHLSKIETDFNNDGSIDIALSQYESGTKEIRAWVIYLKMPNQYYTDAGYISFHTDEIKIIPLDKSSSLVLTYYPINQTNGYVVQNLFSSGTDIKEVLRLKISPDAVSLNEDYKEYLKLFESSDYQESSVSILEYKKTQKINWKLGRK